MGNYINLQIISWLLIIIKVRVNVLIVQRTYTPKPGKGGLTTLLKMVNESTIAIGLPEVKVYRKFLGPHGTVITIQEWKSIEDYNNSRDTVRQTKEITSIFEKIYPLLDSTHVTEILESA